MVLELSALGQPSRDAGGHAGCWVWDGITGCTGFAMRPLGSRQSHSSGVHPADIPICPLLSMSQEKVLLCVYRRFVQGERSLAYQGLYIAPIQEDNKTPPDGFHFPMAFYSLSMSPGMCPECGGLRGRGLSCILFLQRAFPLSTCSENKHVGEQWDFFFSFPLHFKRNRKAY